MLFKERMAFELEKEKLSRGWSAFKGAGLLLKKLEREYDLENEGKRKRREPAERGRGWRRQVTGSASTCEAGEAEGSWVKVAAFQIPH